MISKASNPSAIWLLAGLLGGVGLTIFLQGRPVQATATDHSEDFAIATGHLTAEVEACYLLDFKTGFLQGTVMNRQTGKFQSFFKRELAQDFGLSARQKPKFIMVTGAMQNARAQVPVNHVLYVAELNSGKLAAYFMPYRGDVNQGTTSEPLMILDATQFRQGQGLRAQ
jgi:hypothetical protein